jgi:glutaredoxin-like protein
MGMLSADDSAIVKGEFEANVVRPVKLVMFTQEFECAYCRETRELLEELVELSDLVTLEVLDFMADEATAGEFGIDKIPAIAVVHAGDDGDEDFGIRLYGIPSGYEFTSLLEAIKLVGSGQHGLSDATLETLANATEPIHLQVFVTPTCPYCPQAVVLAHHLAFASSLVTADMVEATEFPHLSNKYQVMGVPRTVINDDTHVEGAAPEGMLVAKLPIG